LKSNISMKYIMVCLISILLLIVFVFPILWMLSSSFKHSDDIFKFPPSLIPANATLENFKYILTSVPFPRYMFNSIFVASTLTAVALIFHSMAGFSFAILRFPGRSIIFSVIIATMMIPFTVRLIPLFIIVRALGWANTYFALIIPPLFHAYGIFLFRQFYLTIPKDLKEAAIIDGCSFFKIWIKIYLPLSRPIIAVLGTIFFLVTYNDFIWPLVIINNPDLKVIQVGLADFVAKRGTNWDIIIAGTAFAAIPTIIIFFFMQRQLVQGIKMTGLKG